MMIRRARQWGVGADVDDVAASIMDLLTWVAVGAIVGARFFYVIDHLGEFVSAPWSVLALWPGGLTLFGGITGGTLAGIVVARRRGWEPRRLVDAAAAGLAAGIAVGRLGDLAIGDHLGAAAPGSWFAWQCTGNLWVEATNSFGSVAPLRYPSGAQPVAGCFDVPVIQTAMFDSFAALITLIVVVVVERRTRHRDPSGLLAATFVIAYGSGRLVLDFLRGDDRYAGLTVSQWTAFAAVSIAVVWVIRRHARHAFSTANNADAGRHSEDDESPPAVRGD